MNTKPVPLAGLFFLKVSLYEHCCSVLLLSGEIRQGLLLQRRHPCWLILIGNPSLARTSGPESTAHKGSQKN